MEKDGLFSWQSDSRSTAEASGSAGEMNNNNLNSNNNNKCIGESQSAGPSSMIMATSCFLNLNWDHSSADPNCNYESALTSLASSPTSSHPDRDPNPSIPCPDSIVIRELIGRLGSICSNSSYSCYSTPLNSPPNLNPLPFAAEAGFAERAAMFSTFGPNNAQFGNPGLQEHGTLSRVSSSLSLSPAGIGIGVQFADHEMISSSPGSEGNARKRKSATASPTPNKVKVAEDGNVASKRCKSAAPETFADGADGGTAMAATERTSKAESGIIANMGSWRGKKQRKHDEKDNESSDEKPPEPPKQDFIHVRARRGQATDSHSLAERVRREKISERMKFLQDLVPGCNKVTGKAVMLDEIINYVQSLQRQVEFLSMKLATVNPRLEFNMDSLLSKDINQPTMMPQSSYHLEASCTSTGFSYENHLPLDNNPLDATSLCRSLSMQLPPLDAFTDNAASSRPQQGAFWEDDLQSVVRMGSIGQNPEVIFSSHSFQGALPTNHMKVEL